MATIFSSPPAIEVHAVSKTYQLWESPSARLLLPLRLRLAKALQSLMPAIAQGMRQSALARMHSHRALSDISFNLQPGESLGIIGLNGSGKSTLLQIIAGVMSPTTGQVRVHGRVAALLELGSGFNPELTGRENIQINAAILGLSAQMLADRMQDIIAFAAVGDYIDEPVKTYSSGMAARLAFAVQVHVDPDVLIVDEALAVGDAQFQAKAMAKIDEILAKGTTLLFVGHDLGAVKSFCKRAMLLERGRIVMEGLPEDVASEYLYRVHQNNLEALAGPAKIIPVEAGYGLDGVHVGQARINGAEHVSLGYGADIEVTLEVRTDASLRHPVLIFDVLDNRSLQISGRRIELAAVAQPTRNIVRVRFPALLQKGIYGVRTRIAEAASVETTRVIARQEGALSFEVVDDSRSRFTGFFELPMQVEMNAGQ